MFDIIRGLVYLHDMDIIHGDLKSVSIPFTNYHWQIMAARLEERTYLGYRTGHTCDFCLLTSLTRSP
jgi:serine/threonine protein kinase